MATSAKATSLKVTASSGSSSDRLLQTTTAWEMSALG